MLIRLLAISALSVSAAACGDKEDPSSPSACDIKAAISYDGQVAALFDQYCTQCHSSTATNRNGAPASVDLDTFADASANANRANARIQAGTMPPNGSVSSADRCTFQAWIDQGATRN